MMSIARVEESISEDVLDHPGAFVWWYVDLVDAEGTGCVVIWSFGLPFLPGIESSNRGIAPTVPRSRPSVNVAVYRRGRAILYTLQEVPTAEVRHSPGEWRIGRSVFRSADGSGRRNVHIDLDLTLPGGAVLRGEVRVEGAACRVPAGLGDDPRHQWSPLCSATDGSARFEVDGVVLAEISGRAYHDRNVSVKPLGSLGIRHWLWGRVSSGSSERVWYLLWPERGAPEVWGLEIGEDGQVQMVPNLKAHLHQPRLGVFGMPWWRRLTLTRGADVWLDVEHRNAVDLGFFYGRWIVEGRSANGVGSGFAEAVRPGRVDRWWNRPLVRMAVERVGSQNSRFLPLFAGVRPQGVRELS
jgi:carotenoid 1,2-hydratase